MLSSVIAKVTKRTSPGGTKGGENKRRQWEEDEVEMKEEEDYNSESEEELDMEKRDEKSRKIFSLMKEYFG